MNEIQIIEQRDVLGKDFKIYGTYEDPLFLARDVAKWIEHSQRSVMIKAVDDNEKVMNIVHTLGGNQKAWFLTEDGLYEVLMQSRKPIAKQFKKKVKEILKEIRKTGMYSANKVKADDYDKLKIQEKNARIRASQTYLQIANNDALPEEYKQILLSYATKELSGSEILPLPKVAEKIAARENQVKWWEI